MKFGELQLGIFDHSNWLRLDIGELKSDILDFVADHERTLEFLIVLI